MTLRYVALGDSYTIGTAVGETDRWPNQLVARLGGDPPTLDLVANPAVNGYTSADLIREELPLLADLRPEFATLLIGVNDVVQRIPVDRYEAHCVLILDRLVALVGAGRIVCVEIPDYTVTPAGSTYGDPVIQAAAIRRNNAVLARLAGERGVAWVDGIFDGSRLATTDRSLVADDGLHPSGAEYARWVDRIEPVVRRLIGA
jgi:lysophospholipase L1-like esterase